VLGNPVDAQQGRVAVRAADDDVERRLHVVIGRDPDVDVGEAAGQSGERPGPPRESREAAQVFPQPVLNGVQGQASNASTTASSMVCLGPVNHFFADTFHQIARSTSVPIVTMGA
jgi:hypothetical protein